MFSNETYNTFFPNISKVVVIKNTKESDIIVGCLLLITAGFGLITYIPCLVAMWKSKQLRSPCYTLMISLGLSDCLSCICWMVVGFYTCIHGTVIPEKVITACFSLLSFGWKCMKSHEVTTAINRYIAVCHATKHDKLYSKRNMILWLVLIWVISTVENIPSFLPPNMVYTLNGYYAVWMNKDITTFSSYEDLTGCTLVFVISVFCYTAIAVKFRQVRKQVAPSATSIGGKNPQQDKERKNFMFQFRLALQTSIRCFTFYIYDCLYYVISLYSDDLWVIFICGTYLWCLTNAMNPWIYLVFNNQLRKIIQTGINIGTCRDTQPTYALGSGRALESRTRPEKPLKDL